MRPVACPGTRRYLARPLSLRTVPATSLESELRAAREAQGLSLEDIQSETRIPVHILSQFEEGGLIGDPTYNEVYLRAFLKSYAKSVGMSQSDVLARYEQQRGGASAPPPRVEPATPPRSEPAPPVAPPPNEPPATTTEPATAPAPVSDKPLAVAAASATPSAAPSRAASPPRAASTGGRVSKPPVPSARRSFDKNWGTIIGLFVAVVAVLGAAIWFLVLRDSGETADPAPVAVDSSERPSEIDTVGIGAGAGTNAPQMQVPITVRLYAGGNGLQNFRVTAEPEERLGHWIEAGDSKTFTSDQAITLWGEGGDGFGDDAVVELQGQRWTPTGTSPIRIDAATGQSLLDSLAARPPGSIPAVPGAPAPAE